MQGGQQAPCCIAYLRTLQLLLADGGAMQVGLHSALLLWLRQMTTRAATDSLLPRHPV